MSEDIFAKTRNGHMRRDMFDKSANTLDIFSNGLYPSNVLSNLAHNEFEIDGIKCGSLEGFLQSLKTPDEQEQKEICSLFGGSAKKTSTENQKWLKTQKLYWQGKEFDRDSKEYRALIKRAFEECYNQNSVFKDALNSTKGIKLIHSQGKTDKKTTVLTSEEFTEILTEIRDKDKIK